MHFLKIFLISFACATSLFAQTITIAAAANLKYAMDDLSSAFTKESGINVRVISGSSGKLTQQIMNGAPYDVFLSADTEYPAKLVEGGYCISPSQIYAYGLLVLWSNNSANLSQGISVLAEPSIRKIAIANPKTAPYGIEAMKAIRYYKLNPASLSGKLVIGESVSQVGTYIATKAVDIGFVAKSIVVSPEMKNIGNWIELDTKSYNLIDQAMVALKSNSSENQNRSKEFLRFMTSAKAQQILSNYGYKIPSNIKGSTK